MVGAFDYERINKGWKIRREMYAGYESVSIWNGKRTFYVCLNYTSFSFIVKDNDKNPVIICSSKTVRYEFENQLIGLAIKLAYQYLIGDKDVR